MKKSNTPRTDELVEKLNVEPWLSTETKCRELHAFAKRLELENVRLQKKLKDAQDLYEANHG
jgi:hypothetical protein